MVISEREMRSVRGKEIGIVLQIRMSALNRALKIGTQLSEAWKVHNRGNSAECRQAVVEALKNVSLPNTDSFFNKYPSQLSVGQARHVLIAMAVMHRPTLLIADEPTSALDIITQSEILQLFSRLSRDLGMTTLYISDDLLSVSTISDRVAVKEKGAIVECRKTMDVFRHPENPYTPGTDPGFAGASYFCKSRGCWQCSRTNGCAFPDGGVVFSSRKSGWIKNGAHFNEIGNTLLAFSRAFALRCGCCFCVR